MRSVEIKPEMVGWFIQTAIEFNPEIRRTEELENVRETRNGGISGRSNSEEFYVFWKGDRLFRFFMGSSLRLKTLGKFQEMPTITIRLHQTNMIRSDYGTISRDW
jgi:hypothetical protein